MTVKRFIQTKNNRRLDRIIGRKELAPSWYNRVAPPRGYT